MLQQASLNFYPAEEQFVCTSIHIYFQHCSSQDLYRYLLQLACESNLQQCESRKIWKRVCLHCRSQELYCHLLQLASLLLTQAEAGPPVLAGGADHGSQSEDDPADTGDEDGITFSAAAIGFGGLEEVLYHFSRAPTPASRAGMVALLVQYLGPPGEGSLGQF